MATMSFRDAMFLLAESRERPTHVGSLMLFDRPEGAGPDYLADLHRQLVSGDVEIAPLFRRRATRGVSTLGQWAWTTDDDVDIEYHVRLSALPRPGRIRELLELVSRLHGSLLDRHRPLWEFHLIEGVEGDRFAVYSKIHHAMMDGVRAMKHLEKALSTDPEKRDMAPFWAVDPRPGRTSRPVGEPAPAPAGWLGSAREYVGGALRTAGTLAEGVGQSLNVGPALVSSAYRGLVEHDLALPFEAPPTMLNVPITGARRFAAQSWPLKRIQRVRERTGSTVNDVMLAMSSGALRRYLEAHEGLPERPLVAALPVALEDSGSGNALGAILVNLATNEPDPAERLRKIRQSGLAAKENLQGRDPMTIAALSAVVAAPIGLGLVPGSSSVNQGFNLIISNVPGPKDPLYWEGAKLDGIYPISVPLDGQALNITVMSYADSMEIGVTGDRRAVPHLQHLLGYLEDALVELEAVADEADPT
ncbi:WS/DGAT/MGAT family O-acyltransferase [Actinomycetospora chibensis]|uniref:Diacylglycerol O-acyltransferase n=1 Tax=Actinomycetospora chibensis TaxID=663606 RepID=A0ABV9RLD1_9PSEU|nr:wax ester/triacylglycerol synthase family O-acyltransferase [Actinomycetospora chibensis]MDD7927785.1 wax ester/triacylglycerol synthase family O-acyltransferase [Actinomycetospora chibensis]